MKQPLQKLVASRYSGRQLPVALVLPDGGRVALSDTTEVDIYARTWSGVKALASPELGKLARAYVRNDIDFSGGARRVLDIAEGLVGTVTHGRDHVRARLLHWWHQSRGNKANIQHHYDVSNAFYRLWLDERMVYSCAYFKTDVYSIDQAQAAKLDHICRKLMLKEGEEFLDIGCGWGGLILWAAQNYGVRATGVTLSQNQFDYVSAKIAELGLIGRVRVQLIDYDDLPEGHRFDKIASIGMFEHVGVNNFPRYFGKIYRLLRPGGVVLNHGITHNAPNAESLGSGIGDFVEEYVFPGGQLAHVARVTEGLAAQGLELIDAEALREHYGLTLWHWVDRLEANADAARREVGEEKYRVWRIYLAGSAHAFDRGWLSLFQLLAGKPLPDGRLPHPLTREYMYSPQASPRAA
jgi:cyclopropane-fatty-acyl-phospholipid synthase